MMGKKTKKTDSSWLLPFLFKYKWYLLSALFAGAVVAYAATLTLPKKYKATAIVYAAGSNSDEPMKMQQGNEMLLLQFLHSSFLRDMAIEKYDLAKHYNLKSGNKRSKAALINIFNSNVDFERTIYKSIKINVKDRDPEFAARLANGIVELTNHVKKKIIQKNQKDNLDAIEQRYLSKRKEVDSLSDEIKTIKNKTLREAKRKLEKRLKIVNQQIASLRSELERIRKRFQLHNLNHHIDNTSEQLNDLKSRYQAKKGKLETLESYSSVMDSTIVFEKASLESLKDRINALGNMLKAYLEEQSRYNKLLNELALQINMRDKLEEQLSKLTNSYEPEIKSIKLKTLNQTYQSQLEQLKKLREKYEEAKAIYNQPGQAVFQVSEAVADYNADYPRTCLITMAGAVLALIFTLGVLFFIQKP